MSPVHVINRYIRTFPAPYRGLILDCTTTPDQFGIYTIYTYKDNTHSFSDPQREELWIWLKGMIEFLNQCSPNAWFQTEELEVKP